MTVNDGKVKITRPGFDNTVTLTMCGKSKNSASIFSHSALLGLNQIATHCF